LPVVNSEGKSISLADGYENPRSQNKLNPVVRR